MLNSALTRYVLVIALTAVGAPLPAQDTTRVPTGVRLSTVYRPMKRPVLAVQPFAGASQISDIVRRDLDYSDRFEVVETPQALATGAVDYSQWSSLSVIFVVAGTITAEGNGSRLAITVHDVPFGRVKETQSFSLPAANAPNFRMAVHAISDDLVRRLTGQPGSAASRIVFTRQAGAGSELMIVDSDGENLQRLFSSPLWIYSPVLSPRGDRVAYAVRARNSRVELHERDLATGADRAISSRAEVSFTPAYSPDGKRLVFAFSTGLGMEIHEYDVEKRCCLRRVTNGPRSDLAPSFSGDGRRIAFQSDRLGQPHIFVTSIDGGQATMLTPYGAGGVKYNAPDWSPTGNEIVFSGESRGGFHLMIADAARPGTADQITETGNNEDPSWAPDGRHIVFTGVGSEGRGLYVIDRVSLRRRILVSGARLRMPEWSSHLAGSTATGNSN